MAYYSPLDDISFVPLTVEEEIALFNKFYSTGDLESRDTLIKNHLKLVAKLALQISGKGGIPDEDAISAANFGLVQALESRCFDPSRGLRFSTYVRKYIYGQVMTAIRNRVASTRATDAGVKEHHSGDATITGVRASNSDGTSENGDLIILARLAPEQVEDPITEETDLYQVRREKLLDAIKDLPEPERLALQSHYFEGRNFADIARNRNRCRPANDGKRTTREGVRKAHKRGLAKLKCVLSHLEAELS